MDDIAATDSWYERLMRAMERVEHAYEDARPIYDKYGGTLPSSELPDRERALVDDLERAESALARLRRHKR